MAGVKRSESGEGAKSPSKKARIVADTAASSRPRRSGSGRPNATENQSSKAVSSSKTAQASEMKATKPKASKLSAMAQKDESDATAHKKTDRKPKNTQKPSDTKKNVKSSGSTPDAAKKLTPSGTESKNSSDGHSYWLMKAEPESRIEKGIDVKFSIQDLEACTEPEAWDGVRNYVARNNMRSMAKGELAFFYHSNCKVPGVVGIMEIVAEHTPDESALDPKHPYYDPKETSDNPRWSVVHVQHRMTFEEKVTLKDLQQFGKEGQPLSGMQLLKMARLSVSKVSKEEWDFILNKAGVDPNKIKVNADGKT